MGCATKPKGLFTPQLLPKPPDYSSLQYWAAHPEKQDSADVVPNQQIVERQAEAEIDVFFLHPTTYTRRNGNRLWNAPVNDLKLNTKTDKYPIRFQASAFNGVGRVFAPYYRQAHIESYYTKKDKSSAKRALDIAYQDVVSAFNYYLENENNGRAFMIASHSQGTHHAVRLIRENIDGKPVQNQLIVAYLVGMPVRKDEFVSILPCEDEEQTNCFCSWRTWKKGHQPKAKLDTFTHVLVTNPLSWETTGSHPVQGNLGTLLRNFRKLYSPGLANAIVYENVLWVDKPKFPWSFLFWSKNFHVADYNFFWMNIRKNAATRTARYLKTSAH